MLPNVGHALCPARRIARCIRNLAGPPSLAPEGLKDYAAPTSAADLRDLLAQSIVEIRMGKLDPKLANSISYLGAGFLRALELADLRFACQLGINAH